MKLNQLMYSLDCLVNTILGGYANESLSSRFYRANRDNKWYGFMKNVTDTIFFYQDNHCQTAYFRTLDRMNLPPEFRG